MALQASVTVSLRAACCLLSAAPLPAFSGSTSHSTAAGPAAVATASPSVSWVGEICWRYRYYQAMEYSMRFIIEHLRYSYRGNFLMY